MKKVIVTTSWDDGAPEDLRVLKLLEKYNLKGTFYIPQKIDFMVKGGERLKTISPEEIKEIANNQEVGAHTLNHIYLDKLSEAETVKEIKESKRWLEDLLGKEVKMFAYPGGKYTPMAIKILKDSGFLGARTSDSFRINIKDQYLMGFSVHAYPAWPSNDLGSHFSWFSIKRKWRRLVLNLRGVISLGLPFSSLFSWQALAKNIFNKVLKEGGVFHLYAHPWEIDRYGLWEELENFFAYLANREDVLYLTNSEAVEEVL